MPGSCYPGRCITVAYRVRLSAWFLHCYGQRTVIMQGPKDVYRGLTGAVLGTIPTAMLYFTTYEWCKTRLEARGAPSAVTHLASASAGAIMSAFIRVPTDTIKHRVQAYMETDVFLVGDTLVMQAAA